MYLYYTIYCNILHNTYTYIHSTLFFFAYIYITFMYKPWVVLSSTQQLPSTNPSPGHRWVNHRGTCNSRLDLLRRSKPCLLKEGGWSVDPLEAMGSLWFLATKFSNKISKSILVGGWVSTHLKKNMVNLGSFPQIFGMNIPNNIWVATTYPVFINEGQF